MGSAAPRLRRRTVAAWSVAAASAIALVPAATASATVTATKITSPTAGSVVDDVSGDNSGRITVTGTATVDEPTPGGDYVRIYSTYSTSGQVQRDTLSDPVRVGSDGRFSVSALIPPQDSLLRAEPVDLPDFARRAPVPDADAFAPTLVLGGFFASSGDGLRFGSGRGQRAGMFQVQPVGGTDYGDLGGLAGGSVGGDGTDVGLTFLGSSSLWSHYNDTRGPITVDGRRGYLRDQLTSGQAALPAPTVTRTVDASTGGQTFVETQLVYLAADQSDDPDEVAHGYVPSGLELRRTVVQDHDGQRATVSDAYRSTDGAAHAIDLLYAEGLGLPYDARIGTGGPCLRACVGKATVPTLLDGKSEPEPPAFRIPWETGAAFATRSAAEPLSAPPAAVSTVYTRVPPLLFGGPPADESVSSSSYGAITFGTRPDGGVFVPAFGPFGPAFGTDGETSQFIARFIRDVPANGTTTITEIYSQAGSAADVATLAAAAERALTPAPSPAPPTPVAPLGQPQPAPVTVTATRVKPVRLTIKATPKRDLSGPRRFRFTGTLVLPKGTPASVCVAGGTVSVQIHAGRETISTRRARLDKQCRYDVRVTFNARQRFGRSRQLSAAPRWTGNSAVTDVTGGATKVRIR